MADCFAQPRARYQTCALINPPLFFSRETEKRERERKKIHFSLSLSPAPTVRKPTPNVQPPLERLLIDKRAIISVITAELVQCATSLSIERWTTHVKIRLFFPGGNNPHLRRYRWGT